jgi:hypothetical protein
MCTIPNIGLHEATLSQNNIVPALCHQPIGLITRLQELNWHPALLLSRKGVKLQYRLRGVMVVTFSVGLHTRVTVRRFKIVRRNGKADVLLSFYRCATTRPIFTYYKPYLQLTE